MICASSWSMFYTVPQSVITGSPRLFTRGGGPYTEGVDYLLKITDVGAGVDCPAGSYVLITATDWNAVNQPSPFNLDMASGGLIAGAVLSVWALGFGFRMLIRALNIGDVAEVEREA
ncbi:MAG: hypothetical protein PHS32_07910 [Rhodoferax sp.]|uniref:hypothetical protein n=1 Tax=Rhodoferax sp. TaxID=50421 RepID=UPI0026319A38|nr:hypothetical protein [Rhodoferax sp.]MDD5333645.1 hypothetical protein [Rhodoferax sp.]MDD5333655.1 hypothetical protein [Rhodoferax sp.]